MVILTLQSRYLGLNVCFSPENVLFTHCRLVYDSSNHFQSYDTVEGEGGGVYFYDYDEEEPAGCQRGVQAQFMASAISSETAWGDIAVNKAAFWVGPAAAAMYANSTSKGRAAVATSVQPILCRAVPVRVSTGGGGMSSIFPVASIAVAAVIVFMALLALLLLCCSACLHRQSTRTHRKGGLLPPPSL